MSSPILRYIFLPLVTKFAHVQQLQQQIVQDHLAYKALVSSNSRSPVEPHLPPPPDPTIIAFQPTPVYTLGRREHGTLSEDQIQALREPMTPDSNEPSAKYRKDEIAEVEETQRGGQITFHGPGQLVIYPIMDLKPTAGYPNFPKGLGVRDYVSLLEDTTISTLGRWGIEGRRTEHPGVWEKLPKELEGTERKIAALGVHLRRNVTSYGVGLNIATNLSWFDRIVACGLEGKGVTSMQRIKQERGIPTEITKSRNHQLTIGTHQIVGREWMNRFKTSVWGSEMKCENVALQDLPPLPSGENPWKETSEWIAESSKRREEERSRQKPSDMAQETV